MKEQSQNTNQAKNIYTFLCAIGMIFFALLRGAIPNIPWVFEFGILGCLIAFLYLYIQYFLTTYFYELSGSTFRVYKKIRKKEKMVCEVPLKFMMSVTKKEEEPYHKDGVKLHDFTFCASINPKNPVFLYAMFEPDYVDFIKIDCSDAFYSLLLIRQKKACKGEPSPKK